MTLAISNFTAYCVQVALVISTGALLPYAFRLQAPRLRLLYWHLLLLACLTLPLIQPWRAQPMVVNGNVSFATGPLNVIDGSAGGWQWWSIPEMAAGLLVAGASLRFLWLCAGFWRLRRYRRAAQPLLPLPDDARRMSMRLGIAAELYISEDVTSPVTFGVHRPALLLPPSFLDLPPASREAVVCHELLHIQRSDWLFAIGEEFVRCLLWFHPAVWWLLGRIQLTREQVVDQAVIEHTQSREQYLDALIAIAATRLQSDLAPAPLFLKKRHLRQRVAAIVKGASMSKRSLLMSSIAVFSALPLVVGIAAWQFPLNAAPQDVRDAEGVTVAPGYYKILHRTAIRYPEAARENGVQGGVVVRVSVNAKGEVTDAQVINGPDELRKAVLESVLNWHFATEPWQIGPGDTRPVPPAFEIAVRFERGQLEGKPNPKSAPAEAHRSLPIEKVDWSALPPALQERAAAANLMHEGDILSPERFREVENGLRAIDDHIRLRGAIRNNATLVMRPYLQQERPLQFDGSTYSFSGPPAASVQNVAPQQIRVGGNVQAANLIEKVTPLYPPEAKVSRVQGVVKLNVTIDREGHVKELTLVSGHPLLASSAMDAVKQWTYKPTLLNGNPVEVNTVVDVNYTLAP